MLGVENANDNRRKIHEDQYRNVRFALSREKGREKRTIPVLKAGELSIVVSKITFAAERRNQSHYGLALSLIDKGEIPYTPSHSMRARQRQYPPAGLKQSLVAAIGPH